MQYASRIRHGEVWRRSHTALLIGAAASLAAALAAAPAPGAGLEGQARTQAEAVPPPLPMDAPLGDPVVHADAQLAADRATAWTGDGAQHLLLEGDVRFELGAYGFEADRAVVRIDEEEGAGGALRHVSVYLEAARAMHGSGPVSAAAPRLLVTVATRGAVRLDADLFERALSSPDEPLVADARERISRHRTALRQATVEAFSPEPVFEREALEARDARRAEIAQRQLAEQVEALPEAGEVRVAREEEEGEEGTARGQERGGQWEEASGTSEGAEAVEAGREGSILPTRGAVYLTYDRAVGSVDENYLMLIGDVRIVYEDYEEQRTVALKAERAVLFTKSEAQAEAADDAESDAAVASTGELGAGEVEGIYLEDNVVVTDGAFTVRAPRMYFDLELNKAVLLEAVMYTYDFKRGVPLYMRADVVRQTSRTSFEAEDALLTTSGFAEPHFAIAASRVTIDRTPDADGEVLESYSAVHNTMRWGGVPIFYWPYLAGANRDAPLRSISGGYSFDEGVTVQTTWDLFALSGHPGPSGVDLLARVDNRAEHGPAFGLLADYERPGMFGEFDSYFLPNDHGDDDFADRPSIEHDGEVRGFARWQHRQDLERGWDLSLEGAYVSDETFLEEFDRNEAYNARDYETSAYLKKQDQDWAATLLAKYDFNNFVPQLATLQTPGYLVDKLPELGFYRTGMALWDDRLTYFSENRLSRMRLIFGHDDPEDRGFGLGGSLVNFGMSHETNFDDAADAAGFPLDWVHRFDTRHEINAPLRAGMFNVTPYVVGRFTGYDQDFEDFSGEGDQVRLWGQVGARATTQFVAAYDALDNTLFDVNRLRHIVRPSVDVFASAATLDSEDLPVYDQDVENIDEGAGVRFGLTNTLQTQRGGPGRWRSVDWIRLKTDLVLRENDDSRFGDDDTRIARFFSYRPEYSTGGDHFYTELLWLVSDTLGIMAELTHDLENDEIAQWRIGLSLQHSSRLNSFIDYEELDVLDLKLLTYGFNYQLTTKYRVGFSHRLDFSASRSRGMGLSLVRQLPRWQLSLISNYDEIEEETTLGIILIPQGFAIRAPTIPLDQFFQPF